MHPLPETAAMIRPRSRKRPREYTLPDEPRPIRYLYGTLILIGFGIAFYLYVIAFNHLSETTLVRLTPTWVFPLVFGIYGLVAEHLLPVIEAGKARDYAQAVREWAPSFDNWAPLILLLLLPFLILGKWRSSLVVSLAASLFWALLLVVFFEVVFPKL